MNLLGCRFNTTLLAMRYIIETTPSFDKWLAKLKDKQAIYTISLRVARAEDGNLGDTKPVKNSNKTI